MKKIVIPIIVVALLLIAVGAIFFNFNRDSDLTKVKVAETAHTVFYAPQYVALEKGFFEEEGLDVELILTPGTDKVVAAVLSGDVQIGFGGSEGCI